MNTRRRGLYIYLFCVVLVIVAVAITAFINNSNNANQNDIRAKAAAPNAVRLTGTVNTYDQSKNTLVVTNLRYVIGNEQNLTGVWQVIVPAGYTVTENLIGKQLSFTVDPTKIIIENKILTALEISR